MTSLKRKKIAHFTPSIISLKTQMDRRLQLLHKRGWDSVGFSTPEHYNTADYVSDYLDFVPSKFQTRRMSVFYDILYFFECIRFLRKARPNVMITYGPKPGLYARIAGFIGRVPRRIHVSWGLSYQRDSIVALKWGVHTLDWFSSFFCHEVHSQSVEDHSVMLSYPFVDTKKFIHVGQGVDLTDTYNPCLYQSELPTIRAQYGIDEQTTVFLIVARICKIKGYVELIDAFKQLVESSETNGKVKLLVCGAYDKSKGDHIDIDLPPIGSTRNNIVHIGRVDPSHIPKIMAAADVFVLPSFKEGLSRSIAEATAMGLPVITSNSRGCGEAIVHEHNGLVVPAGSVNSLLRAMQTMVEQPELRSLYGRASRELALKRYDENRLMDIIEAALEPENANFK